MKKFILFAAALLALAACTKDPKKEDVFGKITYGGDEYRTITLPNGQTWMVDPLCYVPAGMTISDDPTKAADICYPVAFKNLVVSTDPTDTATFTHTVKNETTGKNETVKDSIKTLAYKLESSELVVTKDEAQIRKQGLLYSFKTIFGVEVTEDNYNKLENAQGICPDGWHIPSNADWKALVGNVTGDNDINKEAYLFNEEYQGANIPEAIKKNWLYTPSGSVISGKYNTTCVNPVNTAKYGKYVDAIIYDRYANASRTVLKGEDSIENALVGYPSMNYIAGSSGYKGTSATAKPQIDCGMTTFTGMKFIKSRTTPETTVYPDGKIHVARCNIDNACVAVRCIKNAE